MMSLIALLDVAQKSAEMAERDPHGWIMTLVAVSVVFLSLFILQYCYRFIGWLNTDKASRKISSHRKKADQNESEVAAAIATALSLDENDEVPAAIALALHRYFSECAHDRESYRITIKRKY
ncbi:MAG: OadG family protein [Bacteroidales bacterium]|nr:OadG family protein [Bacteroidales bacterium]